MSSPLTASHRIEFEYTVDGVIHKLHQYCRAAATTMADPTGYDLLNNSGAHQCGASAGMDAVWGALTWILVTPLASFGVATLQLRSGTVWNPIAFWNTAVAPTHPAAYYKAAQLTVTLRTTTFKRFKVQVMETEEAPGQHEVVVGTVSRLDQFIQAWNPGTVGVNNPSEWATNRSGDYIPVVGWFVAATTDLNDKLRRRRGIA